MHLKFSHKILMVFLPMIIPSISIAQLPIQPENNPQGYDELLFTYSNFTRPKRQLFREDIPHHRPLSGNVYALEHGWPHPGRWADGQRSLHRPNPNLPRPHQHYIDMLEGNRHGRYHNVHNNNNHKNHNQGGHFQGGPQVPFGGDIFHNSGGSGGPSEEYGPPQPHNDHNSQGGPEYGPGPINHEHQPNNDHDYDGPSGDIGPGPGPSKGPPPGYGRPSNGDRPKTVVHYHPIQYGNILNFPQQGPNDGPGGQSVGYGPPNHESGPPLGPISIENGGFIPSKGPIHDAPEEHGPRPFKGSGPPPRNPYRFDPFKIFSFSRPSRPSKLPQIEHDVPVAVPILAQFHSARPVKFSKVKQPIHVVYGHAPPNPGRRRPPFFQHHFLSRPPTKQHSQWLLQHGL